MGIHLAKRGNADFGIVNPDLEIANGFSYTRWFVTVRLAKSVAYSGLDAHLAWYG